MMEISVRAVRCFQFNRKAYLASMKFKDLSLVVEINPDVQRELSPARVNRLHKYIVHGNGFIPAITVSSSSELPSIEMGGVFRLLIDNEAKLAVNDGQHRVKAVEKAVKTNPELGEMEIPVLIFEHIDRTEQRQLFHDLNFYPTKVAKAKAVHFDSSDLVKHLAKDVAENVTYFSGKVEMTKPKLSPNDDEVVTLGILYEAVREFVGKTPLTTVNYDEVQEAAVEYWEAVGDVIGERWSERENGLAATTTAFRILGRLGNKLQHADHETRTAAIQKLGDVDWSRDGDDWVDVMVTELGTMITGSSAVANASKRLYQLLGLEAYVSA